MGEIADGLINGDFDFHTGEYIGRGGGFPRTRHGNFFEPTRRRHDMRWKQVTGFMDNNGIKQHLHPQVLKDFGCKYSGKPPVRNAAFEALKDFEKFKEFALAWKNNNLTP